jgi:hypothetical protein
MDIEWASNLSNKIGDRCVDLSVKVNCDVSIGKQYYIGSGSKIRATMEELLSHGRKLSL